MQSWRGQGLPALPTRFGMATGPVVVGNMGARTRLAYTVLGDTVNPASRLEGLNKVYGTTILVDIATRQASERRLWLAPPRPHHRRRQDPGHRYF